MREPFEPNWADIHESAVWQKQIKPWLETLYDQLLEGGYPPGAPGTPFADAANLETYHYHRGGVDILRQILLKPEAEVDFRTAEDAKQKKDEADAKKRAAAATRRRRSGL